MNPLTWKHRTAAAFAALFLCVGVLGAQLWLAEDYAASTTAGAADPSASLA